MRDKNQPSNTLELANEAKDALGLDEFQGQRNLKAVGRRDAPEANSQAVRETFSVDISDTFGILTKVER